MSIILENDAKNFTHPTPFILHYSNEKKEKYFNEPKYICGNSHDPDLAAHIVIIIERGLCLFGKPIHETFQTVPKKYYIESIVEDINSAKECIVDNPVYLILNLCRVLLYLKEEKICSKKEGGEWGYSNLPTQYKDIIKSALLAYSDADKTIKWKPESLVDFADFMLRHIQKIKTTNDYNKMVGYEE